MTRPITDYTKIEKPGGKALRPTGKRKRGSVVWLLACTCGVEHESGAMAQRRTYSCRDCAYDNMPRPTQHGDVGTTMYSTWCDMKSRCYNPNVRSYKTYGARGISVCALWRNNFLEYKRYVEENLGSRPSPEHTIDRIDNDGNYEPGNLRWASKFEQTHNRTISNKSRKVD